MKEKLHKEKEMHLRRISKRVGELTLEIEGPEKLRKATVSEFSIPKLSAVPQSIFSSKPSKPFSLSKASCNRPKTSFSNPAGMNLNFKDPQTPTLSQAQKTLSINIKTLDNESRESKTFEGQSFSVGPH